jgi:riboflavin synthase alpha subunit
VILDVMTLSSMFHAMMQKGEMMVDGTFLTPCNFLDDDVTRKSLELELIRAIREEEILVGKSAQS